MNSKITPNSLHFAGRILERSLLANAIQRTNAVLLYGGRQAGKTALLRRIAAEQAAIPKDANELSQHEIYVYVDLMRLPYDATPSEFFALLATESVQAGVEQIKGFARPQLPKICNLEDFISSLDEIRKGCFQIDLRLIFLLDEAKRVLGSRFPRGFQDNLFSLLFGEPSEQARVAMVFSGTQHLNEFLKDDTSPIGSRSQSINLVNLGLPDVKRLGDAFLSAKYEKEAVEEISALVHELTGGHAGLTTRTMELVATKVSLDWEEIAQSISHQSLSLFENWATSFSAEARFIAEYLIASRKTNLRESVVKVEARGLNKFFVSRAFDELQYSGVAIKTGDSLIPVGTIFWSYFSDFQPDDHVNIDAHADRDVWHLVEETELAMREIIKKKFEQKFGLQAENRMAKILGEKAWGEILAMQKKSSTQYKYSRQVNSRELMSCMYIGQLGMLMTNGLAWDLFKTSYRDKRELEDKLSAVMPVRNDRAHFNTVPKKELDRCRIACDDLLAIAERMREDSVG